MVSWGTRKGRNLIQFGGWVVNGKASHWMPELNLKGWVQSSHTKIGGRIQGLWKKCKNKALYKTCALGTVSLSSHSGFRLKQSVVRLRHVEFRVFVREVRVKLSIHNWRPTPVTLEKGLGWKYNMELSLLSQQPNSLMWMRSPGRTRRWGGRGEISGEDELGRGGWNPIRNSQQNRKKGNENSLVQWRSKEKKTILSGGTEKSVMRSLVTGERQERGRSQISQKYLLSHLPCLKDCKCHAIYSLPQPSEGRQYYYYSHLHMIAEETETGRGLDQSHTTCTQQIKDNSALPTPGSSLLVISGYRLWRERR